MGHREEIVMPDTPVYDAIVVGGGLAGLTSAAYLSRAGRRVLLCEKNGQAGGLVNSFVHQGLTFDGGIRAFENSGIIRPMLKDLGIELTWVNNPVAIGIADQIVKLTGPDSLADYQAMLTRLFPKNEEDIRLIIQEIKKVMQYMDVLYGIDNPLFIDVAKDRTYLMQTLLPWLLRYQVNMRKVSRLQEPINPYLRRLTANQALVDMITQHFFQNTPAFFALSYFSLYLDYSYPVGGTGALADQMVQFITRNKGEIRYGSPVSAVDAAGHQVRTADGRTFGYRKLIWTADQKTFYARVDGTGLGHRQQALFQRQKQRVMNHHGGDSVLTLFLTIDLDPAWFASIAGAHIFYTATLDGLSCIAPLNTPAPATSATSTAPDPVSKPRSKNAVRQWLAAYLQQTTYEISCPALRDASLAPPGQTGLIVSTLLDYNLTAAIRASGWYDEFKQFCADQIIDVLNRSLCQGFREKISGVLCATPLTIERLCGNDQGAITGWAFGSPDLPAENHFKKIARSIRTPFPDIYQAGQWVFSPSGLPVSILTGKLAADAVQKSLG